MESFLNPKFQITKIDANGALVPLNGGKITTYEAGTTTPKTTYSDRTLSTPNTNPVILNSRGEAAIYFSGTMKIVVTESDDTSVYTLDNLKAARITVRIIDDDGDTYHTVEDSADEDKHRFYAAGVQRLIIDTLIRPQVAIEMEGVAIQDADGDTRHWVDKGSSDDDTHRFDCAGNEQVTIQDGKIEPTVDDDIDLGSSTKQFKDLYLDGIGYVDELNTDTINERTGAAGVTIDGVLLKDNKMNGSYLTNNTVSKAKVGTAAVGQDELKTSTGEASSTSISSGTHDTLTIAGGTYSFFPQAKTTAISEDEVGVAIMISNTGSEILGTTYATRVNVTADSGTTQTISVQNRYVSASGPLNWLFIRRDIATKEIQGSWFAPDHPSYGNGGDPDLMPHPFVTVSPSQEVVVLNPTWDEYKDALKERKKNPEMLLVDAFLTKYDIDEVAEAVWPTDVDVSVDLEDDIDNIDKGQKILKKVKIKKPAGIKYFKLKKK